MDKFDIEEFYKMEWWKMTAHYDFLRHARRYGVGIWADGTNGCYWVCACKADKFRPLYPEQTVCFVTRMGARNFCKRYNLEIYYDDGNLELSRKHLMLRADGDEEAIRREAEYLEKIASDDYWDWINHFGTWKKQNGYKKFNCA